ncbi:MAG: EAL domain-containing protein, partial [Lachnospiraceae bacterium]|nr:EAL domain-containing protein [Lachnospiraceae bacterium]
GDAMSAMNIFMYGYAAFMLLIAHLLLAYRKLFYRRIMFGFYGTIAMSFILLFNQGRHGHSSFTTVAFLFPVIAMLYILHSNPYDNIELGTVNARAFEDMVSSSYRKKKDFIFASLYLPELDVEGRSIPREIYESIRRFSIDFFKGAQLFQITNGHMILAAWTSLNPDYKYRLGRMLNAFQTEYMKYRYDYKIVIGSSIDEVSRTNEGLSFIRNIHRGMKINDIHRVSAEDVEAFKETKYIIEELVDIFKKKDLNDPRVLVFCQPVYNIKNGRYDTAEALMRLELPKTGMVYPDRFIPLAEEYGFIHVLTEILLNKTCKAIKAFLDEGYDFKRISVNVSSLEMRDDEFNNDMNRIILESGIPDNKIAFEITESQSEMDFMLLKSKINELKGRGIKFYLDDFGTGYSNMERILELPFDIIKFDKSLVIASDNNERSRMMVESLADMFARTNYSVLYEGIETESDEERCINMSASYLQGYKYSRPVPINELKAFLSNCHLFHT